MPALILVLLAAAAPEAPAAAPPPKVVSPLVVSPQPKQSPPIDVTVAIGGDEDSAGAQEVSIWPAEAYAVRATGHVTLTCHVDVHGLAESCRVAFEQPQGKGFGQAALAMRPNIKVPPHQGTDGPEPAQMNIGLVFKAPDTETTAEMSSSSMNARAANVEVSHNALSMRNITLMNNPVWVQAPDFATVARAYPEKGAGLEGYAVAHCGVRRDGALANCRVAKEQPAKHGFGAAAMKLALQFRVDPEAMARAPRGAPVEVDVPIRFAPPGAERKVTAPLWLVRFDPEAAPRLFPPQAAARGLTSGRGIAKCRVGADGAMTDCSPDGADPEGLGFAEAAAKLASGMKMNLWSADAGPVAGGAVRVGIDIGRTADQ